MTNQKALILFESEEKAVKAFSARALARKETEGMAFAVPRESAGEGTEEGGGFSFAEENPSEDLDKESFDDLEDDDDEESDFESFEEDSYSDEDDEEEDSMDFEDPFDNFEDLDEDEDEGN